MQTCPELPVLLVGSEVARVMQTHRCQGQPRLKSWTRRCSPANLNGQAPSKQNFAELSRDETILISSIS